MTGYYFQYWKQQGWPIHEAMCGNCLRWQNSPEWQIFLPPPYFWFQSFSHPLISDADTPSSLLSWLGVRVPFWDLPQLPKSLGQALWSLWTPVAGITSGEIVLFFLCYIQWSVRPSFREQILESVVPHLTSSHPCLLHYTNFCVVLIRVF